jgi:hypothetical protein
MINHLIYSFELFNEMIINYALAFMFIFFYFILFCFVFIIILRINYLLNEFRER